MCIHAYILYSTSTYTVAASSNTFIQLNTFLIILRFTIGNGPFAVHQFTIPIISQPLTVGVLGKHLLGRAPHRRHAVCGDQVDGGLRGGRRHSCFLVSEASFREYGICSMYGIFGYIYPIKVPNVVNYSIHGAYGSWNMRGIPGIFMIWWDIGMSRIH